MDESAVNRAPEGALRRPPLGLAEPPGGGVKSAVHLGIVSRHRADIGGGDHRAVSSRCWFRLPEPVPRVKLDSASISQSPFGSLSYARRTTRPAAADARDDALLGGDARRRIAAAALQFLRQDLFPAAAVLPGLRLARGQRVSRHRQRAPL